jgi:predicted secreted protein
MPSLDPINGTNLLVYVNGEAIMGSKTCKLSVSHDVRDTTTKDSAGWAGKAEGLRSWTLTADGLAMFQTSNVDFDDLLALITTRTKVHLKFSTELSGDSWWYGDGWLKSIELDAANEDSVSYSCSFEGTGVLTKAAHT